MVGCIALNDEDVGSMPTPLASGESSNGRTQDFGPCYEGSNPSSPAIGPYSNW